MPESDVKSSESSLGQREHHHGWPPWLQQLGYFGGLMAAIILSYTNIKSDVRSSREEQVRMVADLNAIRQSLPNKEVYDLRLDELDTRLDDAEQKITVEQMMTQKLREDLLKKGVID